LAPRDDMTGDQELWLCQAADAATVAIAG